jgi:DnaK suppressor protein
MGDGGGEPAVGGGGWGRSDPGCRPLADGYAARMSQPTPASPDLERVLAGKAADIEAELTQLQRPADETGGISFGKRVGDGTSIAVERLTQVAAFDRLQVLLTDVRRAQAKLAEGSYGVCDTCGARIPADRLVALPWAVQCMACRSAR